MLAVSVTLFYGGPAALLCKCATGSNVPGKVASKKGEGTPERVLALAQALLLSTLLTAYGTLSASLRITGGITWF